MVILKSIDNIGGKERLKELVRQKLKLTKERVEEICRKDIDTELIFELPKLLGEDLTAAMSEKK